MCVCVLVLGKGGVNIKIIQKDTGARCDKKEDEFLGNIIVIVGTEGACKRAKKAFEDIIAIENGPPKAGKGQRHNGHIDR